MTVKAFARRALFDDHSRGNSIPCSLTKTIDSTQPGQITCVTIAPTLSSSGKVVLYGVWNAVYRELPERS